MRRLLASAALLIIVGCGSDVVGSSAGGTAATSASAAATQPPELSTDAPIDTGPNPTASDVNPLDGAAFCAFLGQHLPGLQSAGSADGALAQFAIDLAGWLDEHPDQKPRTASDLDAASLAICPDVQAQAVAAMGAPSFNDALG